MKRLAAAIVAAALALATGLRADAQPQTPGGPHRGGEGSLPMANWGGGASGYINSIDRIVKLTDAQKKKITEIFAAREKTMKEYQTPERQEKHKAAAKAMQEARQSHDRQAVEKAEKAYKELYAPIHEMMKKNQADLEAVLTPEQKEALKKAWASRPQPGTTGPSPERQAMYQRMKELYARLDELTKAGKTEEAEKVKHQMAELREKLSRPQGNPAYPPSRPGGSTYPPHSDATSQQVQQLRSELQELRHQVEELKAQLRKEREQRK